MAVVVDYLVLPGAFALGYITRYPDCQLLHGHCYWPCRTTHQASSLAAPFRSCSSLPTSLDTLSAMRAPTAAASIYHVHHPCASCV